MSSIQPKKDVSLIARSHVESSLGGKLRVVRLEPSKEGKRLLTSSSTSIPDGKGAGTALTQPLPSRAREAA